MTKANFIKMLTTNTPYKYSNFTYQEFFYGKVDEYTFYFRGDRFSPFYLYFSLSAKNVGLSSQMGDEIVKQLSHVDGHSLNGYRLCLRLKKVNNKNILTCLQETITQAINIFKKEDYKNCCEVDGKVADTRIATYGKVVAFYDDKWLKLKESEIKSNENKGGEKIIHLLFANILAAIIGTIALYLFSRKDYILLPTGLVYGLVANKAYLLMGNRYSRNFLLMQAFLLALSVVGGTYLVSAYFLLANEVVTNWLEALNNIPQGLSIGNFFYMQLLWLYLFSLVSGLLVPYLKIKNYKKENYLWILK